MMIFMALRNQDRITHWKLGTSRWIYPTIKILFATNGYLNFLSCVWGQSNNIRTKSTLLQSVNRYEMILDAT